MPASFMPFSRVERLLKRGDRQSVHGARHLLSDRSVVRCVIVTTPIPPRT